METDFCLSSYRFDLPEAQIAQCPPAVRGASRLMVLPRQQGPVQHALFSELISHLPENCLLVANNSRVVPARLFGQRPTGGRVECLVLTPLPLVQGQPCACLPKADATTVATGTGWQRAAIEGLLRSSKKVAQGETVAFSPRLQATLLERGEFGHAKLAFYWQGDLLEAITEAGRLPLPPYIKRQQGAVAAPETGAVVAPETGATTAQPGAAQQLDAMDAERYQTVYAHSGKAGSVAAPTAGLHFTPALKEALLASGRQWAEVTLYVGYGTFSPVRCEDIRQHPMHAEYAELSPATAAAIEAAKQEGRPVITVGTTSTRVLEGIWQVQHEGQEQTHGEPGPFSLAPFQGWINTFLYPGKQFHVIDGLITNFHLPESSLLMLVSALVGRERVLDAYTQAVQQGYRFFSYGDAMLITP
ncbi:S-adenosylmethionine:tRNA ribosyltransferase-isomerase [Desulfovibrio cuneatus]|uniref:S-adenosylmethionine:tRNA ribosyltransferase-isomerase n=1 Tax=Desulfovibrio cuneatus TaxID=159728 RepID=UPI000415FA3E|nr:S-adenosylmethionine:tRNA ribosyltransferase-isomerase [Desulfovibrio cuneatus]